MKKFIRAEIFNVPSVGARLLIFILGVILLSACTKSKENEIIGTWISFNNYDGIMEYTFSKDNLTIKNYHFYGGELDTSIIRNYEIFDDIIIIENSNRDEYFFDSPYYNYSVMDNKLFLSGLFYTEIFTKKTEKNLQKEKSKLIGNWIILLDNTKYEFKFVDDNVTIIKYDVHENIIEKSITSYDINEHFLVIENITNIINDIKIYSDNLFYYIGKNNLIFFAGVGRNDTIESKSLFLSKK